MTTTTNERRDAQHATSGVARATGCRLLPTTTDPLAPAPSCYLLRPRMRGSAAADAWRGVRGSSPVVVVRPTTQGPRDGHTDHAQRTAEDGGTIPSAAGY